MDYARLRAQNLPISSGVIEATCKTLVTQRMKRSGQHWTIDGGQAILTFRALAQSERFDAAWKMVAAEYQQDMVFPENVLPFPARRTSVKPDLMLPRHISTLHPVSTTTP
jgi:hypothetical protein